MKCDQAECGFESEDVNDFVISADRTVCLSCAEALTAEAEAAEAEALKPKEEEDLSGEEGAGMTVEPAEEEEPVEVTPADQANPTAEPPPTRP